MASQFSKELALSVGEMLSIDKKLPIRDLILALCSVLLVWVIT